MKIDPKKIVKTVNSMSVLYTQYGRSTPQDDTVRTDTSTSSASASGAT